MRSGEAEESPKSRESKARNVYSHAYRCMWQELPGHKEEALLLLESWRDFEKSCVAEPIEKRTERIEAVQRIIPRRVKRKRAFHSAGNEATSTEVMWDYVLPHEEGATPGLKLLEAAYEWKKTKDSQHN